MAIQRDKVIASAEKLVAKGKIDAAIKEYERLIEESPNDVNTLNRIGDLWVRINNNGEAVKVFTKIADHYSRDGFFLKAIAIYKKINKLDPSKLDVYAKLADLYAKQGLAMEAKSQYQVLADYYLKHGDPGNALAIYRKITELDPNSINVHVKLADLFSQNGQTAEALKEYDLVGRMLLKRSMLDEAVQVFKKALKIDSKNVELVDSLVTALLEARDFNTATQVVEHALEANRDNPRLLAIWSRIQLGRGDLASARSTLERAVAANPQEPVIRETLADIYLRQGDADRALSMLAPVAESALARGERGAAIEALSRILRVTPGHAPTLARMVATYIRLNEETNILASMNSLAEAHIANGNYKEAASVLEQLIEREPQNAQHRTKLQFVRSQSGVDTLPATPKAEEPPPTPPPLPSLEIEEPMPSFDLDADSGEAIELDMGEPLPMPPAEPEPMLETAPAPRSAEHLPSAVDLAAADLVDDDLDFITEHLTEAEVFAKYGLSEKAIEHLRAVLERSPKNTTAHDRLFRLLLDEGQTDAARAAATAYVDVLRANGEETSADMVAAEFTARGQSFEAPAHKPAVAKVAPPPEAETVEEMPVAAEEAEEELTFDLEPGAPELEIGEEPAELSAEELQAGSEEAQLPAGEEPAEWLEDLEEPEAAAAADEETEPEFSFDVGSDEPSFDLGAAAEPEIAFDLNEAPPPPIEQAPEPELPASALDFTDLETAEVDTEQPFFGVEGGLLEERARPEDLGEIDFYVAQELFDEARLKAESLLGRYPDDREVQLRHERMAAAAEAAAVAAAERMAAASAEPEAAPPPSLSRAEIENELMFAIPDDDEDFVAPPPPPPAATAPAAQAPAAAAAPMSAADEENLFADEDDFFDLAAELESELSQEEEPLALSEEEQSLEQIFKEFKKGVEQQLDSEDYDTHYNLGIAYKEMGLIDEAIGEFQLASKDPKRAVECSSMLGLCFLEKGMPQLAIKWYRKGLEIPEITEEEHVGLLYDLGSAYLEVGDTQNAQKAFMEVYGMNTNYRDVVSRIRQLESTT